MNHRMLVRTLSAAVVAASLTAGGSADAGVAIGASFGYSHLSYPDLSTSTDVIGIPGSQEWGQPGLRVGYLAPSRRWDLNVDAGLVNWSNSFGNNETRLALMPQIQVDTGGQSGFVAFVTGGVGLVHEHVDFLFSGPTSATRPVFGAGVGVRKSVADGHGLVRAELRFDHVSEYAKQVNPTTSYSFPATNMISVKLGFDLLVSQ